MIEHAMLSAIKSLLVTNRDLLTSELSHQGAPIILRQITTSGHTPPISFPFVSVMSDSATTKREKGNSRGGEQASTYRINISIVSRCDVQPNEDQAYELSDDYHKILGDRIVSLIMSQDSGIRNADVGVGFKVDFDEGITKTSGGTQYEDSTGFHSRLVSEIRFTIRQECVDNEKLYN